MKTPSLTFAAVLLALCVSSQADDRTRNVQLELKSQGFYYGEVNGQNTAETGAAIRRYQIRNGLEVTGTLTDETTKALSAGGGTSEPALAPQQAPPQVEQPTARPKPPTNLRRDESVENSDRSFLNREESRQAQPAPQPVAPPPQPRYQPQPQPPVEGDPGAAPTPRSSEDIPDLPEFFVRTPYATAPREVQWSTLRRAQTFLAGRGIYHNEVDGDPGPATEEAILTYQRSIRLPLTGRLDLETLNAMHLLPGRSPVPLKGFMPPGQRETSGDPRDPRALRGIWVR